MRYRTILFNILIIVMQFALVQADVTDTKTDFKPIYLPSLGVTKIASDAGEITIDGELHERIWRTATKADNFVETSPGDQIEPDVKSEVLITYDESNLYLAFIAYDNPDEVRVSLRERDNIFRDDYFGIMLDTYGNQTWGYELFVNPYGVQGDLRVQSSGNEDSSLDIVFESEGIVTDSGYQVELAIPFASLRFPNIEKQNWRANFWRDRQREKRKRYSWAARSRDEPCSMCQYGFLTGIENIKPSSNFDIMPNIVAFESGTLKNGSDPSSGFEIEDPDAELSLNARYGITSNSSAEITFNPDFSQVESDAGQINVNTTFGLFFPERRPFFQEGSDLFDTWISAVYTRTINDPQGASKFTGQFGNTSAAYLIARDENSTMLIPFQEQSFIAQADKSIVNIGRVRHTFSGDSHVGLIFTDRRLDDFDYDGTSGSSLRSENSSGSTYGFDSQLRIFNNYRLEFQVLGSHTKEPNAPGLIDTTQENGIAQSHFDRDRYSVDFNGESFNGHGVYASFERDARKWNFDMDYWEYSPTFRTDNGFTNDNDYRLIDVWNGVFFRPNKEWLVNWEPSISFGRKWDHTGEINLNPTSFEGGTRDEWLRVNLYARLKWQTDVSVNHLFSQERFSGKTFPGISIFTVRVDSRFSEVISGGVRYSQGKTIARRRMREYTGTSGPVLIEPELGYGTDFSMYANFKPSERIFIQPNFTFSKLDHRDQFLAVNFGTEKEIFSGYIFRTRATYQFSREWYLRLIVQYNDFSERLDIEPLITYRVNPFTVFFVGINNRYKHFKIDNSDVLSPEWGLSDRQFFAKVQYLFRK